MPAVELPHSRLTLGKVTTGHQGCELGGGCCVARTSISRGGQHRALSPLGNSTLQGRVLSSCPELCFGGTSWTPRHSTLVSPSQQPAAQLWSPPELFPAPSQLFPGWLHLTSQNTAPHPGASRLRSGHLRTHHQTSRAELGLQQGRQPHASPPLMHKLPPRTPAGRRAPKGLPAGWLPGHRQSQPLWLPSPGSVLPAWEWPGAAAAQATSAELG